MPSSCQYILIYNPSLPPSSPQGASEDDIDAGHVVFYSSQDHVSSRDSMLRQVGLAKGLNNFAALFAPGTAPTLISSARSSLITLSPEPGFFLHANVSLEAEAHSVTHHSSSRHPTSLHTIQSSLIRACHTYTLLNGPMSQLLASSGRQALEARLEEFWNVWVSDWRRELESGELRSKPPPPSNFPSVPSPSPSLFLSHHHAINSAPDLFTLPLLQHLSAFLPDPPPLKISASSSRPSRRHPSKSSLPNGEPSSSRSWLSWTGLDPGEKADDNLQSPTSSSTKPSRFTGTSWLSNLGLPSTLRGSSSPSSAPSPSNPSRRPAPSPKSSPSGLSQPAALTTPIAIGDVDTSTLSEAMETDVTAEEKEEREEDEGRESSLSWKEIPIWQRDPEEASHVEEADWTKKTISYTQFSSSSTPTFSILFAQPTSTASASSSTSPLPMTRSDLLSLLHSSDLVRLERSSTIDNIQTTAPGALRSASLVANHFPSRLDLPIRPSSSSETPLQSSGHGRSLARVQALLESDDRISEIITRATTTSRYVAGQRRRSSSPTCSPTTTTDDLVLLELEGKGCGLGDADLALSSAR